MPCPEIAHASRFITWELLVWFEPRLAELKKRANRAVGHRDCRWHRYEFYRRALRHVVGFDRIGEGPDFLFFSSAYEIAHREILGKW